MGYSRLCPGTGSSCRCAYDDPCPLAILDPDPEWASQDEQIVRDFDTVIYHPFEPSGYGLKDSGARQEFDTGAVRDVSAGKGYFHLLPFEGLERIAKIFEAGSTKYGERNWERGIPMKNFINSGIRHLTKAASGRTDEDHLAMAAWNILCALATEERIVSGTLPRTLAYSTVPE